MERLSISCLVSNLTEGLSSAFGTQAFSAICLGRDIAEYADLPKLLTAIKNRLEAGGWLLFSCKNPFFVLRLHAFHQFMLPENEERCVWADPALVRKNAEAVFHQVQVLPVKYPVQGLEEFARQHYGKDGEKFETKEQLSVQHYYFACQK